MVRTKVKFDLILSFPNSENNRILGEKEVAKFVLGLEMHLNRHLYSMGKCDPMETVYMRWHAIPGPEPEGGTCDGGDEAEEHF